MEIIVRFFHRDINEKNWNDIDSRILKRRVWILMISWDRLIMTSSLYLINQSAILTWLVSQSVDKAIAPFSLITLFLGRPRRHANCDQFNCERNL